MSLKHDHCREGIGANEMLDLKRDRADCAQILADLRGLRKRETTVKDVVVLMQRSKPEIDTNQVQHRMRKQRWI